MVYNLIVSFLEYSLVGVTILDAGSPYSRAVNADYYFPEISAVLILALFFFHVGRIKRSLLRQCMTCFIPYYVIAVLYMIVSVETVRMTSYIARFLILLPVSTILFCQYADLKRPYQLLQKYVNVITVLAVISLFFWAFGSQLGIIKPTGWFIAHWGTDYQYPSYFGLYFERQHASVFGISFGMRNQGVFCEGPMYSLNLVFSIAIYIFLLPDRSSKSLWKQIILIVTLITTFTTTGFILLLLIFGIKLLQEKKLRGIRMAVTIITIPLMVWGIYSVFIDKSTSSSWLIRLDDFRAGLLAWQGHPIFGNGWSDRSSVVRYMSSFRSYNTGYSNTIMQLLAEGGICLFALYAIPIVGLLIKSVRLKQRNITCFMFVFLLEFIFTIFTYFLLMLFFLSLFYASLIVKTK